MTDFPPEPAPSWRGVRDRIEAALLDLDHLDHARYRLWNESDRRTLAGLLRRAFAPQLAIARTDAETLDRVRKLVRRHRFDEQIPRRELEAALYGEER